MIAVSVPGTVPGPTGHKGSRPGLRSPGAAVYRVWVHCPRISKSTARDTMTTAPLDSEERALAAALVAEAFRAVPGKRSHSHDPGCWQNKFDPSVRSGRLL